MEKKSGTTWDVKNPVNHGINCLSTGAGFLPSTVSLQYNWVCKQSPEITQTTCSCFFSTAWFRYTPPKKSNIDTKNECCFKMYFLSNMAILDIHVSFQGCISSNIPQSSFHHKPGYVSGFCSLLMPSRKSCNLRIGDVHRTRV